MTYIIPEKTNISNWKQGQLLQIKEAAKMLRHSLRGEYEANKEVFEKFDEAVKRFEEV